MKDATSRSNSHNSRDFYSLAAPFYDAMVGPFLRSARKDIVEAAKAEKCRRILDVACGTGEQAVMLARAGFQAAGIDLSPAMLRQAREKSSPSVAFFLGDGANMPFARGSFDCVTISLALHEMEPEASIEVLAGMLEILSPGGKLIVFDYARPDGFISGLGLGFLGLVEWMAGKRHFRNFVRFARAGAGERLLSQLHPETLRKYFLGALGLYIMRREGLT
jgi:ubiquinone/menaquinone biosynthesis C-methylase UbiE